MVLDLDPNHYHVSPTIEDPLLSGSGQQATQDALNCSDHANNRGRTIESEGVSETYGSDFSSKPVAIRWIGIIWNKTIPIHRKETQWPITLS